MEKTGEATGYAIEFTAVNGSDDYRMAIDGYTVLIPQPSDDPHDPLY